MLNKKWLGGAAALALALCCVMPAAGGISKTSKRILRSGSVPAGASDFGASAVSTSSLQWSWSTGAFTGSGIDGYYLYTSSAATKITLTPDTSFYIDAGLGANKQYTRWITAYQGTSEGSDSWHIEKYTYAQPPATFSYSQVTSTGVYITWTFSAATAYEVQTSTDAGVTYAHNRAVFVPFQHLLLLSNNNYLVRMGAINGDNEVTPGLYSAVRSFTTPPHTPSGFAGAAVSSYTITWSWDPAPFSGTGVTGYTIYMSSRVLDGEAPEKDDIGVPVHTVSGEASSSWTEVYVDSVGFVAANSRHTRWLKAEGIIQSTGSVPARKFTYAIAPATCSVVYLDPDPYQVFHVWETSVNLTWNPRLDASEAAAYVVDYTTAADFAVALSTARAGSAPFTVTGLTGNTKYDMRVGALNGDAERTPENASNPMAVSMFYRLITSPHAPSNFKATPYSDTALDFTWSTTTYVNPQYISGYTIGELKYDKDNDLYYLAAVAFMPGVSSSQYTLDYLITNSTHTRYIWASQYDPDFSSDPHYPDEDYRYKGGTSGDINATGATYATPPNDVAFDTITAHTVGMWWKEPEVPATLYRVERSTTTGEKGPWIFVANVAGAHFQDSGLLPTTTYSYRIGAINRLGVQTLGLAAISDGNRRDYSFVRSTFTLHLSPTLYGAAAGTDTIRWWWDNTVPGVLSFAMYTSTDGIIITGLSASATYWTEVGISSANARCNRRLRSLTAAGAGDFSAASVVTLALAPSGLSAAAAGQHSIAVTWTDNGSTRYKVDRSPDGLAWANIKAWSGAVTGSPYSDTGLRYATTYYYAVSGYNEDGLVSASSSVFAGGVSTLQLAPQYSPVYSTAAQSAVRAIPGVGQVRVDIPAGAAADGYIYISTDAAASPEGATLADLNTAASRFLPGRLMGGKVTEVLLYNASGNRVTSALASPAHITFTYTDADGDGVIDGSSPAMEAASLKVLNLDTSALEWAPVAGSALDAALKTVAADVSHFSFYAAGSYLPVSSSLSGAFAYPNPYRPGSGGSYGDTQFGSGIVFENLPARVRIRVFNTAGGLVADLDADNSTGRFVWDTRAKGGGKAASGVYFYIINNKAGGDSVTGKLAIIR